MTTLNLFGPSLEVLHDAADLTAHLVIGIGKTKPLFTHTRVFQDSDQPAWARGDDGDAFSKENRLLDAVCDQDKGETLF